MHNACHEASNWLANLERFHLPVRSLINLQNLKSLHQKALKLKTNKFKELEIGSQHDHVQLANLLAINIESIKLTEKNGTPQFSTHFINDRCRSVVDFHGYVRQDRRLDGKPLFYHVSLGELF